MDLENINKSIESLGTSFAELKKAQEQAQKDTDGLVQKRLDDIANDVAKKLEDVQTAQQKMQAALERVGNADEDEGDKGKEARAAFRSYMSKGKDGLSDLELKQLSTDDNPNGGYLVPTGTLGLINGRVFETSPMRRLADVRSTTFKSVTMDLDDGEATGRWEGEGSSSGETDTPPTGQIEIAAKKMEAEPRATIEDLQDAAFDMESWLAGKVADVFSRMENTAFVTGDGVLRPRGFLTHTAGTQGADYVRGSIEQIANGSTTAPTENGLIDLIGSLKEEYQPNATLVMKRLSLVAIMKLAGATSYRFLNLQPTGAARQTGGILMPEMTLMEKPVVLFNDMPAIGTNALSIAYGDFKRGYQIVDRVGISVLRDPYTAKGRVKFYTTKRVGGHVKNFEAIKLLKMA